MFVKAFTRVKGSLPHRVEGDLGTQKSHGKAWETSGMSVFRENPQ